ncbi:hypothetical protein [Lysinibacillus xylanilyticus]|uniref:hypothetical protein n=1 Tax=Lysinibacillus xylanilyticus TaxID=582475 RepID=UPI003D981E34
MISCVCSFIRRPGSSIRRFDLFPSPWTFFPSLRSLSVASTLSSVALISFRRSGPSFRHLGSSFRRFDSFIRRPGSSFRRFDLFPSFWTLFPPLRLFHPSPWIFYPSL